MMLSGDYLIAGKTIIKWFLFFSRNIDKIIAELMTAHSTQIIDLLKARRPHLQI